MHVRPSRSLSIDALKAIASQLIVLHHLAFYGPMSDAALVLAPDLISWLYDYGRVAVQAFLVVGGYLAAQTLSGMGALPAAGLGRLLFRRYLRLILPYLAALLLAIAAAALASRLIAHESIPAPPSLPQLLAHLFLMHGVLGFDALSAGVWYVAIDFQLFVLLAVCAWLGRRLPGPLSGSLLVGALGTASLLVFNRHTALDNWAIYFFGAYALGAAAWWGNAQVLQPGRATPVRRHAGWTLLLAAIGLLALWVEFRLRIAVALTVALLLAAASRATSWQDMPGQALLGWLSRIAYAVFLVHFPVVILCNALFARFAPPDPWLNAGGIVLAWALSVLAGALFHHFVEQRLGRWQMPRPATA
ncbi:acyltransferase family protein [Uliginosibacterium sp. H1]|uniref:acyltransferase family protein n=1 Tax=Uliginosibacterium sp. H1 TaxID=3114757 RepID=UPI002E1941CD|nr:acyltransferase family protein [Uliginosibacterium sp. H1]